MMLQTSTGPKRLKGILPKGTQVAHKTGTAFREKKTFYTLAVNDIGVVFISPKEYYYINVFVTDSNGLKVKEEDVIAQVNKIVWDYYQQNRK